MGTILIVFLLTICFLFVMSNLEYYRESNLLELSNRNTLIYTTSIELETSSYSKYIYVTVSGEVNKPGKYKLENGDMIEDLIKLCGGLKDEADEEAFYLYYILQDGDSVYIPKSNGGNKISINTADVKTLDILPGVGESIAKAIIEYREINGEFYLLEDLKNVSGIGDSMFDKIKDFIRL